MRRVPMLLAVTLLTAGCAMLHGSQGPTPETELARGVAALRAQKFADAHTILEPIYRAHYMDHYGQRALMLLSVADLDPRNDARRLESAAYYATMLINVDSSSWERPIAESLYLLSQELGGHEEELANAEAAKQQAQQTAAALQRKVNLPSSSRESWPARLNKVQADKDALSKKVDQLQAALKAKDKDLTDAQAELDRIKKTLKIK